MKLMKPMKPQVWKAGFEWWRVRYQGPSGYTHEFSLTTWKQAIAWLERDYRMGYVRWHM